MCSVLAHYYYSSILHLNRSQNPGTVVVVFCFLLFCCLVFFFFLNKWRQIIQFKSSAKNVYSLPPLCDSHSEHLIRDLKQIVMATSTMGAGSKNSKNDVVCLLGNDLSLQRQILQHEYLSHGTVTTTSIKVNFSPFFSLLLVF